MIKPICRDILILGRKSADATREDMQTVRDLADTLRAHLSECVGMAANMIGINKRVIAIAVGPMVMCMINPRITAKSGEYRTEEGCLSLSGKRATVRYRTITVEYLDEAFSPQRRQFEGFVAQIIQHEVDHCNGIVI